jgi:hypothetical protein
MECLYGRSAYTHGICDYAGISCNNCDTLETDRCCESRAIEYHVCERCMLLTLGILEPTWHLLIGLQTALLHVA